MIGSEKLHQIRENFEVLNADLSEFDACLSELCACRKAEEFFPRQLRSRAMEMLKRIDAEHDQLQEQFQILCVGDVPQKIESFLEVLERLEKTEQYTDAVSLFMTLYAEQVETQELLDRRKASLAAMDFQAMDENTLRETAECYVWLSKALQEEDPVKRFTIVYKLAGYFEEPITREVQFRTLRTERTAKTVKSAEGIETGKKQTDENSDRKDESARGEKTPDILGKCEPKQPEPKEDASEQEKPSCPLTEPAEQAPKNTEENQDDIWSSLGIDDPAAVICEEETEGLEKELSSKSANRFGVKEFKKDIAKYPALQKRACLLEANEHGGYTRESIALWYGSEQEVYDLATDKLYQQGYLTKYTVKGAGEYFALSPRGSSAFRTKDSRSFLLDFSHKRQSEISEDEAYQCEETVNRAIARIACYGCYGRTRKIDENYEFPSRTQYMGREFFFIRFPAVIGKKDLVYMGIFSERPEQFRLFYEHLKDFGKEERRYLVLSMTREKAAVLAKWVKTVLDNNWPVWYCGISEEQFFDSDNDEVVDLLLLKEQEEMDAEELSEDLGHSEKPEEETPEGTEETEDSEKTEEPEKSEESEELCSSETPEETKDSEDVKESENSKEPEDPKEPEDSKEPETVEHAKAAEAAVLSKLLEEAAVSSEEALLGEQPEQTEIIDQADFSGKEEADKAYQNMLTQGKFCAAAAYVKVLSASVPEYEPVYRQLAYALNDPMENCSYSSNTIFSVYFNQENLVSDYFVVSAALRNYFYDQFSYDYSLKQLQDLISGNRVLQQTAGLDRVVYTVQQFKAGNHRGMDRYADYREKEKASWDKRLEEIRREAKSYYENYSVANIKENASHKRFIETGKLLLGPSSDLSEYLKMVIGDQREMLEVLEQFLTEYYVKDQAEIREENIEPSKIDAILDTYWELASKNLRVAKKTSDLMSSLRMNLFKRVRKVVAVLCNYVFLLQSSAPSDDDPALGEYRKVRNGLLKDISEAMLSLRPKEDMELSELAGRSVLKETLHEIQKRLEGSYIEGSYKYFYVDFLKNDHILLDDEFLPVLDEVVGLPQFSVIKRIFRHCGEPEKGWEDRLKEILSGEDDYGSAELILQYLREQKIPLADESLPSVDLKEAMSYPLKDMQNKRQEFIEDLELAQSYGQIDNAAENVKEIMLQIMENWYVWALETKNFGFFDKILEAFRKKIRKDAQVRAEELNQSLEVFLGKNPGWDREKRMKESVEQIRHRIGQQNYAAAEDLLNRLLMNDIDFDVTVAQTDCLQEFLDEYDVTYKRTANSGTTLKALFPTSRINKDTKGGDKLLENWPRGAKVGEAKIKALLSNLGFSVDTVKTEAPLQGKIESYLVKLKRPQNGRKSNYKHPISAFGSEAEEKGFRVVCLFGKTDASRLIDTFKDIGNAKNTLVLLDYSLTLADRRTLARKTKTDLTGKIFAVIDRVVLVYLAKNYTETSVNRMLMSVIMPFASCQPYIDKSADVMPQEMFIGRKNELDKIESPTGVNIVYGGRQLGKTALLRMAKKDIDLDENGDRAVIVNAWRRNYRETAKLISETLYDEGILKTERITEDWNELARDIKNRLRDQTDPIPYLLLMIDEADVFIESCEEVGYQPFDALKDIQSVGTGRFKFVVAGLRNIVRFQRMAALSNNSVLTHLDSLTVKPFKSMEARELLEVPLSYLGFRFPNDSETEVLISTIFGTTNYFPGLIQLYCTKLIEAMKRDYAGYSESETPPYYVRKEHIKKILAEQSLQDDIRDKFMITLKVGDDDYYYIIALLVAYHYHEKKFQNGCSAEELLELAGTFSIGKLTALNLEQLAALMEEMRELNVLQHIGDGRYRFTRYSFCQMMGTAQQIDDELLKYMED